MTIANGIKLEDLTISADTTNDGQILVFDSSGSVRWGDISPKGICPYCSSRNAKILNAPQNLGWTVPAINDPYANHKPGQSAFQHIQCPDCKKHSTVSHILGD